MEVFPSNEEVKLNFATGGYIHYNPNFLDEDEERILFDHLINHKSWDKGYFELYNKTVLIPRLTFTMSGDKWSNEVCQVKKRIERELNTKFTYAYLNLYRDGKDYISYHSDRETCDGDLVASLSLGQQRKFRLKSKFDKGEQYEFDLKPGSLIVLNWITINRDYKHSVPKQLKIKEPRINITFRNK